MGKKHTMYTVLCDLDGTLTEETEWYSGCYSVRTPKKEAIEELRKIEEEGAFIILHSARLNLDLEETKLWLKKQGVPYNVLTMSKPRAHISFDDRSVPTVMTDSRKYLFYDMHRNCSRWKEGGVSEEEEHPCFFCGEYLSLSGLDKKECSQCGIMKCPHCGKCLCNVPVLTRITLSRLHEKYCCNLGNYDGEIELDGFVDMNLIKSFQLTLDYCKMKYMRRNIR